VTRQLGVGLGDLAEALDLGASELEIAVGGGEMTHQPDYVAARRGEDLRETETAHAGVELEMDAHALGYVRVHDGDLESRLASPRNLGGKQRAHHENARRWILGPQLERLGERDHAESAGAGAERRAGRIHSPVPVGVRLHDRPQV
jgi:hypothetical protein